MTDRVTNRIKVSLRRTKRARDEEQIVATISKLHRAGEALNITSVKRRHPRLLKRAYAVRPFLGWKRALEAAGIDYGDIRVDKAATVTCRICRRRMRVLAPHITRVHETSIEDYLADYPGAELVCEQRRAELMGRDVRTGRKGRHLLIPHWEPVWSAEYVLDRIAELHRRGMDLNAATTFSEDRVGAQAVERIKAAKGWYDGHVVREPESVRA